jgi:hypothetical protein
MFKPMYCQGTEDIHEAHCPHYPGHPKNPQNTEPRQHGHDLRGILCQKMNEALSIFKHL